MVVDNKESMEEVMQEDEVANIQYPLNTITLIKQAISIDIVPNLKDCQ